MSRPSLVNGFGIDSGKITRFVAESKEFRTGPVSGCEATDVEIKDNDVWKSELY